MRTDLSVYNNSWYKPGNSLKRITWHCINLIFFKSGFFPFYGLKRSLLRLFGGKIGKGVLIKPAVNIKYPWLLTVGDHVWIGENVWIDNVANVTLGNNVCLSQGALLLTGNHNYKKISFDLMIAEITLEDGVWIGARAIVCPGVTCKSHAILSVGSVATQNLEPYSIYLGNPAIKCRQRLFED